MMRTVDSDVVILAVYACDKIEGIEQLWIDFGVGKHRRYISAHQITRNLPKHIVPCLPFFHAFTGCDTVSTFCGIGKRSAWKSWLAFREVDECFEHLSTGDLDLNDNLFNKIQRFVVIMYDRVSPCATVNECRRVLYTKRNRAIENIPPTAHALLQHTKRAALQAHIWTDCLQSCAAKYEPTD